MKKLLLIFTIFAPLLSEDPQCENFKHEVHRKTCRNMVYFLEAAHESRNKGIDYETLYKQSIGFLNLAQNGGTSDEIILFEQIAKDNGMLELWEEQKSLHVLLRRHGLGFVVKFTIIVLEMWGGYQILQNAAHWSGVNTLEDGLTTTSITSAGITFSDSSGATITLNIQDVKFFAGLIIAGGSVLKTVYYNLPVIKFLVDTIEQAYTQWNSPCPLLFLKKRKDGYQMYKDKYGKFRLRKLNPQSI